MARIWRGMRGKGVGGKDRLGRSGVQIFVEAFDEA